MNFPKIFYVCNVRVRDPTCITSRARKSVKQRPRDQSSKSSGHQRESNRHEFENHHFASSLPPIYIYACNLTWWAVLGFQDSMKQQEIKRNEGKMTKKLRKKKPKIQQKQPRFCGGFSGPFFTIKLGAFKDFANFLPTNRGYSHIYIYILWWGKQWIHIGNPVDVCGIPPKQKGCSGSREGADSPSEEGTKATQNGNHYLVHIGFSQSSMPRQVQAGTIEPATITQTFLRQLVMCNFCV